MNTAFKIAVTRAKMVARSNAKRAAEILVSAGCHAADAVRFVLSVLRAARGFA